MSTQEPDVLKEMAREIDAVIASKAANDEESLARAVRIKALEQEMGAGSKELFGVRRRVGRLEE